MSNNIQEAIDYLAFHLRKATLTVSGNGDTYYEVDAGKNTADELIKLANSTDPGTWFAA